MIIKCKDYDIPLCQSCIADKNEYMCYLTRFNNAFDNNFPDKNTFKQKIAINPRRIKHFIFYIKTFKPDYYEIYNKIVMLA